jgi:hypothetical protein
VFESAGRALCLERTRACNEARNGRHGLILARVFMPAVMVEESPKR